MQKWMYSIYLSTLLIVQVLLAQNSFPIFTLSPVSYTIQKGSEHLSFITLACVLG